MFFFCVLCGYCQASNADTQFLLNLFERQPIYSLSEDLTQLKQNKIEGARGSGEEGKENREKDR